jgi:uncharacterized protein (UPF0332 family)
VNPVLFLTQAQRLASAAAEEDWRTATSRAYYAAFHIASIFMTKLGFAVPNAERAHAYLWLRLQNCGDATVQRAGIFLNDLRRQRTRADYDLRHAFTQARTRAAIQDASILIQVLDSVVEPTRTQVMNAMKDYERVVLKDVTWHS